MDLTSFKGRSISMTEKLLKIYYFHVKCKLIIIICIVNIVINKLLTESQNCQNISIWR